MNTPSYSKEEIVQRGKAWFEQSIRSQLGEGHDGNILVIDVVTGDYEVDADQLAADRRLRERHPDAVFFGMRIGYPTLGRVGGGWRMARR